MSPIGPTPQPSGDVGASFKIIAIERPFGGWQHVVGKRMAGVSAPLESRELGTPSNAADVGKRWPRAGSGTHSARDARAEPHLPRASQ